MPNAAQQNPKGIVIGLTGPVGSGVSTVAKIIQSTNFTAANLATPIKQAFCERHGCKIDEVKKQKDWRQGLQDIGDEGRAQAADYWIKKAVKSKAKDNLVITGIRNYQELQLLRKKYGNFFLIAVTASRETRWKRARADYNGDERAFDRDDERDADGEIEYGQQVERCVQEADYVFKNENDHPASEERTDYLKESLNKPIRKMQGLDPEDLPLPAEAHMATAYAQSHCSHCLKRRVGAVIVGTQGWVLSLGFNDNPDGVRSCKEQWHTCYKDRCINAFIEAKYEGKLFCPKCGKKIAVPLTTTRCKCGEKIKAVLYPSRGMELCMAIHAEERAIRSLADRRAMEGTMYVTTFPCFQCARHIIDAGIKKVVYLEAYPVKESLEFFQNNDITIESFSGFTARSFSRVFRQLE